MSFAIGMTIFNIQQILRGEGICGGLLHIASINTISLFPIIGATKKALEELEKKRQKREVEEEDFKNRLERLLSRNNEIAKMREANTKLLADMKIKVKKARSKLSE